MIFLLKKSPGFWCQKSERLLPLLTAAIVVVVVVESMPSDGKISRQNALTRTQPYSVNFF